MDSLKLCIFTIKLNYVDKIPFKRGDDVYHLKEYLKFNFGQCFEHYQYVDGFIDSPMRKGIFSPRAGSQIEGSVLQQ